MSTDGKKLRIWSHLLEKSLMKNFIFCAVLAQKILKVILEEISKDNYKGKQFFQKSFAGSYLQKYLYSYIDVDGNDSFYTELEHLHDKERYLNLKFYRKAMAKIRLSSHKLSILRGKWYKIEAAQRIYNFCN